jgi:hypothetical protein
VTKTAEELEQIAWSIFEADDAELMCAAVPREGYDPEHWWPEWQMPRLLGKIDDDRLEALDAGAEPTTSELDLAWRECIASDLEDECGTRVLSHRTKAADGSASVVVILMSGLPQDVQLRYFGAFETDEDAKAALLKEFYLDLPGTALPARFPG